MDWIFIVCKWYMGPPTAIGLPKIVGRIRGGLKKDWGGGCYKPPWWEGEGREGSCT